MFLHPDGRDDILLRSRQVHSDHSLNHVLACNDIVDDISHCNIGSVPLHKYPESKPSPFYDDSGTSTPVG